MANKAINNIPFTIYTVKNESSKGVNIYLGIASINNTVTTSDYFPHRLLACKTSYLFASIVGTRNVKITRPTTIDPYIYVETRKVTPESCGSIKATSLLKSGNQSSIVLRTITSDASVKIDDYGCNYGLSTFKYKVANACNINGLYYKTIGIPGKSHVQWFMKSVTGGGDISIINTAEKIIFVFESNPC